jgi:DNA gyrase subunit A
MADDVPSLFDPDAPEPAEPEPAEPEPAEPEPAEPGPAEPQPADPEPDTGATILHFPWDGEKVDYSDAMLDRGRAYGSYVITSRAIPDVRDGLKPVQRRIIVAMDDLGLRADRKYSKSAKTVGTVIGNYHPHGDTAVYDAMVRMAQPWQSNLPLVDGQGNWGNLNNEAPAAAQRYTESRLSPAATAFLSDLRPEVVDYEWNFDETRQMPGVLPVTFPNLLVNGSMGVAWAMACSIPPHNTTEVIDAALLVLDDPDVSLDRLLAVMPGPDLPGGGIVVNPENLRGIYETGRGTVLVQGRIEQLPGQPILRITELPYQVSAKSIVEQAVQGAKDGKITEIFTAELPKNLTDADGVDVQVKCKRGGSITTLTRELLQHTKLRDTLAFNCTVLVDNVPQTLGLRDLLRHFVDFRRSVVTRRLEHEREVLLARLHLLLAERAAADVIDRVVQIIRHADDDEDSKRKLMAELRYRPHGATEDRPIDDAQAQHIIDMALKKINTLNQLKIDEEIATRSARVDEITATLDTPGGVPGIVRTELREARKRFGQPRRTVIPDPRRPAADAAAPVAAGAARMALVAAPPAEEAWAWVAADGLALLSPQAGRPATSSPLRLGTGRSLAAVAAARADQLLLVFSEQGQAYRTTLTDLPVTRSGAGRPLVPLARNDHVVAAFSGPDAAFYLLVTAAGQVKRLPARTLESATPEGIVCCRVPHGDRIVAVVAHGADDQILLAKAGGQVLRLETGDRLRAVPTAAAGTVAGVKVDPGDRVVDAVTVTGDRLVSIQESGLGLVVAMDDYPQKGRGTAGVQSVLTDRPARTPAGPLALVVPAGGDQAPTVFTDGGAIVALDLGPDSARRASNSRPLVPVGTEGTVRGRIPGWPG